MKTNIKTTCDTETINSNNNIKDFEELVKSNLCMMYFARGCRNTRRSRGLCNKHYHMVRRCVISGSLTWEKIEKQLKALPLIRESLKDMLKILGVK